MTLRLRFTKRGRIRWISQRDTARLWERTLRRAGLPVAYTAGFSPRPQLAFGLALPTGCESDAEYVDVRLTCPVGPGEAVDRLAPLLPDGVTVAAAAAVEPGAPSLQAEVTTCSWAIEVPGTDAGDLARVVAGALAAPHLPLTRHRKGRTEADDLRPSILDLQAAAGTAGTGGLLLADLATRPRGVRPAELETVLGVGFGLARRTSQWIERDGSRTEPLAAASPPLERAS